MGNAREASTSTLVKLYVQGIPFSTQESELRSLFARVGVVTECRVVRDYEGRSRGFAFVTLDLYGRPTDSWRELQGHGIVDSDRPDDEPRTISIDFAHRKAPAR